MCFDFSFILHPFRFGKLVVRTKQCQSTLAQKTQLLIDLRLRLRIGRPQLFFQIVHPSLTFLAATHVTIVAQNHDIVTQMRFEFIGQEAPVGVGYDVEPHVILGIAAADALIHLIGTGVEGCLPRLGSVFGLEEEFDRAIGIVRVFANAFLHVPATFFFGYGAQQNTIGIQHADIIIQWGFHCELLDF
eukprot:CAMPEP_0171303216 /NCGR_PEP_ID=MMETSP0816-20121228/12724_1 /TAXON_ID=420281 /ORGANISM="Proboscia inermis, Strain CCAP1064/1" /LENGTH=187 /DNA_ID=CAMNT_0011782301 /DNA_START=747 /DNA_END=1310 /DNA_ORIENTATION=-